MLLGHSDSYTRDKQMQVTIAYNHFGEGLIQRMPRYYYLSFSSFHISENDFLMCDRSLFKQQVLRMHDLVFHLLSIFPQNIVLVPKFCLLDFNLYS